MKNFKNMKIRINRLRNMLINVVSSRNFFITILVIASLQGLWYALSFKASMYDELHHFDFTRFYTNHMSPFVSQQDSKWDFLGEVTRNGNYLFYYIMSWPLRLAQLITDNLAVQLIFLRLICISFFVTALVFFRKAFLEAGVKKYIAHLVLLFFILTPGVAILPGVFNYDNIVIFLTALLLYIAVKTINDTKISFYRISSVLLIGLVGTPIKMTFLVIYVPIFFFLTYYLWKKYHSQLLIKFRVSFEKSNRILRTVILVLLVISTFIFIERTVINVLLYQKISAPCTELLTEERCLKNPLAERAIVNKQKVQDMGESYKPIIIQEYFLKLWAPHMIKHQASPTKVLPVMKNIYYSFALGGLVVILLYARSIIRKPQYFMMLLPVAFYPLVVLYTNYSSYVALGIPVAMNGRYLFPILPIILLFFAIAVRQIFKNHKNIATILLLLIIIAMTQGGGIITYVLDHFEPVYWDNTTVHELDDKMERVLRPLVKGR